jgi:hypothetical protein
VQETVYHFHVAQSVPKLPPIIPRVKDEPVQIGEVEEADVGAVDEVVTKTVVLAQVVVRQGPSALTQYVVVPPGLTTGDEPEVKYVPVQETVYHFQVAPSVPKLPPIIPRVEDEPEQIGDVEEADVGAIDEVVTTTVVLAQVVVRQGPSALTQYVVVPPGLTTGDEPEVK